jgi:DNA-binding CsgD family transcriptional regulator
VRQYKDPTALSPKELEILKLVGRGKTSKEISKDLGISDSTLSNYLHNIFEKIEVSNRAEAAEYAVSAGLVSGFSE